MSMFIPYPGLSSDVDMCILLDWLEKRAKDPTIKKMLPIISYYRNQTLLVIESNQNYIQALASELALIKKPEAKKKPVNYHTHGWDHLFPRSTNR